MKGCEDGAREPRHCVKLGPRCGAQFREANLELRSSAVITTDQGIGVSFICLFSPSPIVEFGLSVSFNDPFLCTHPI